ncbi:MAG: isopentenyl-diphosphate Delta-isomerase [Arenicellales bacterium]|nr:isopentenyl-diphosphate Delta-isomerase [Arenicellales bacterium]
MNNLAQEAGNSEIVSFDSEELILVDRNDVEVGHLNKEKCHDGDGLLHRAFSLFIFNEQGELLVQKRSAQKRLWPLYWSNSCCSHPRHGEVMEDAVVRRLHQELGMRSELVFLYKFIYQAQYNNVGSEHELCWVYIGTSKDPVRANPNEVADWRFLAPAQVDYELSQNVSAYSPWMKLEWETIQRDHQDQLIQQLHRY